MRHFRPLFLADLDCRTSDLHLLRLSVNRHLPEHLEVDPHRHRFHQLLFYLTGQGEQELGSLRSGVVPGSLVLAPASTPHAFHRTAGRAPLCLVMDFRCKQAIGSVVLRIPERATRVCRSRLHDLSALRDGTDLGSSTEAAGIAMWQLGFLLGQTQRFQPTRRSRDFLVTRVEQLLNGEEGLRLSIHEIAAKVCCQQDHLNRRVKQASGLTLQQLRARQRLLAAQHALRTGATVADAGSRAGIDDPNYFVRWFKRQAGMTPGAWSRRGS